MEELWREWNQFALGYEKRGVDCPCVACSSDRAIKAWVRREHQTRPPDDVLRDYIEELERRLTHAADLSRL